VTAARDPSLDVCGCEPRERAAPAVANRPGLPALDYRISRHGASLARMLGGIAALSLNGAHGRTLRPLESLTTRSREDPAIALLDGWATVADVLSFYQERIANEGFLRTATERRSVLELARTIGYELNPGVAASTYLVFAVERREPPPGMAPIREALVPMGTRVQSMPGQDELPQTFETSADFTARADWNEFRPRLTVPQPVSLGSRELFVAGIATGLARGDRILITAPRPDEDQDPKTPPPPGVDISILEVTAVEPDAERERTRIALEPVPKHPPASQPSAPTPTQPAPDLPFDAPDPPADPPVTPAKLDDPVFALVPRPLTADEIAARLLRFTWEESLFQAQLALLAWNPIAVIAAIASHHPQLDLGPVYELVEIQPARDTTRPTVLESFPKDGTADVHPKTNVTVRFSEPMDASSAMAATTLRSGSATGTEIPTGKEYRPATGTVVLDPLHPDTPEQKLPAEYKAGDTIPPPYKVGDPIPYYIVVATSAKDAATRSNTLAAQFEAQFFVLDIEPPVPTKQEPEPNDTGVPAVTKVSVEFGEEVRGVSETSFFLRDAAGTRVPASLSPEKSATLAKELTLTPRAPLALSSRYTVTLTSEIVEPRASPNPPLPIATAEWTFSTADRPRAAPDAELAVYSFRERAAFFGHNAPKWATLPKHDEETQRGEDPYPSSWDDFPRSVWVDSQGSSHAGDTVFLDRTIPGLEPESWALFESATGAAPYFVANAGEKSLADYGLSSRAAQLKLSQRDGSSPSAGVGSPPNFRVRETEAHVKSERLELVELPIETPLMKGDLEITLDELVIGLRPGQAVALRGELHDLRGVIGNEILIVESSLHTGPYTTLRFRSGLTRSYVRKTATLTANVVEATHGETIRREILGGGDGTQANQRFVLKRPPLTYVSAPTPSGSEGTLEVRVDDVLWSESPVLYGLGPTSQRYIVRTDDEGKTAVVFGDGAQGARPPTGAENVVATYRSGIGMRGLLGAERLTLLQDRPLGIASVTNPLATTGAEEPENRDSARANAPLTVLTMERIVSLTDFEDFARAFAGVGKAQAIDVWRGETHLVHLTVAAANGDEIATTSQLYRNLVAAIDAARDPGLTVFVDSYVRRFFDLEAEVRIDLRYVAANVLDAVRAAILAKFSFQRRGFGQPVSAAEVVTVIQGVPGVISVDLNVLYELSEGITSIPVLRDAGVSPVALDGGLSPASGDLRPLLRRRRRQPLSQVLFARRARVVGEKVEPAQLLLVSPAGGTFTERKS
jgi:Bacterial Ig-like domain/Baseplate J-like protein